MDLNVINMRRTGASAGNIVANFDVEFGDTFIIRELKLVKGGKDGMFISVPQRSYTDKRTHKEKWVDTGFSFAWDAQAKCRTKSAENLQAAITEMAVAAYEALPAAEPQKEKEPSAPGAKKSFSFSD